jgi:prepilin-type processing-associated H-X9-DG protein
MIQTPLNAFYCPARRPVQTYTNPAVHTDPATTFPPGMDGQDWILYDPGQPTTRNMVTGVDAVEKNDYAGNSCYWLPESVFTDNLTFGAAMATAVLQGTYATQQQCLGNPAIVELAKALIGKTPAGQGGIVFRMSQVTVAQISDGTSNVILCGEKYIDPHHYFTGLGHGDQWHSFGGYDPQTERYNLGPIQDQPGYEAPGYWGSVHAGMCNMAFCDGSVHQISYGIATKIMQQLCNRADGAAIDASMY